MMTLLDADEIKLLTEIGFLAAARADVGRAEVIFCALQSIRPHRNFVYVGLAMTYLNADRADEAVEVLTRGAALVADHDLHELESIRALALQMAGRTGESQRALVAAGSSRLAAVMQGQCIMNQQEI